MKDKVKNVLLGISAATALALGGAAIAGAADDGAAAAAVSQAATTQSGSAAAGPPRQRSDEELLTGEKAARVREAASAEADGGTIERLETDAEGNAAYEAHIVKADGTRMTVYVNEEFEVVSVDSGR